MKFLILLLFPAFAFAGNTNTPRIDLTNCVWGRNANEHQAIEYTDKSVCAQRICTHAVKCKQYTTYVNCPSKNGRCEGYSADECVIAATQVEAEYDTSPRR